MSSSTSNATENKSVSFVVIPEHEHVQDKSVLAVLSNARSAAKSARGPILSTAPFEPSSQVNMEKIMNINNNNNSSAVINNNNRNVSNFLPGAPLSPQVQRQLQQERDKKLLATAEASLHESSERRFLGVSSRNNNNNNSMIIIYRIVITLFFWSQAIGWMGLWLGLE